MAETSAFAAVVARYQTFTDVPDIYTFDGPTVADGVQVYPSYVVALDDGTTPSYEMELTVMEVSEIRLMVYGDMLATVDAIVERIKYNGGGIGDGDGMDFCQLDMTADFGDMEVRRISEQRFAAVGTGKQAQRIHGCELKYRVTLYRYSAN